MSTEPRVNKLKAAMQGMAGPALPPTVAIPEAAEVRAVETRKTPLAPSRRGKRNVSAYVDAAAAKQLAYWQPAMKPPPRPCWRRR